MDGDFGVAHGSSSHQTEIARMTAPPPDESSAEEVVLFILCAGIPFGLFFLFLIFGSPYLAFGTLVVSGIVAYGLGSYWYKTQLPKKKAAHKIQLMKWGHKWLCLRCGHSFYVR